MKTPKNKNTRHGIWRKYREYFWRKGIYRLEIVRMSEYRLLHNGRIEKRPRTSGT